MADLTLRKVTLRNWGKFRNVDLEFPDYGLVMVRGVNTASGGALQSVGSGKTIFGESFSRALMGIRGRFEHLKKFSRDKKGDTYVCVEADLLGKPLKVEMGFQCEEINPRSEGLRFSYDGQEPVERGTIAQTREELIKLIQVPPLLATWTVFVNGKKMDFSALGQDESVELVMSSLRQPPWREYHENVKRYMRQFNKTLSQEEGAHRSAAQQVKEAEEDVVSAQTEVTEEQAAHDEAKQEHDAVVKTLNEELDALTEQMTPLNTRQKELEREMKRLEQEHAAEHKKLEIRQRDLQEEIRQLKERARPLLETQTQAQRNATTAETNYTNYRDAKRTCPTCKQAIAKQLDQTRLDELKASYEAAAKSQETAEGKYNKVKEASDTKGEELEQVMEAITALGVKQGITEMSEEHAQNERKLDTLSDSYQKKETRLTKLGSGPSKTVLEAAKTKLEERKRIVKKAKEALRVASEAMAISKTTERVLNYWNTAFSPYGIPNMVLREAIGPLNHEAKRISAAMTGGTIEVLYSTTREMASGIEKAKLNIEVNNLLGSKDLEGSSNGEAGLTNYIVSETLANVGQVSRRIGYRWYDEIVPHQDAKVCHSIYSYWKELAQKLKILILMVDHNPIAANYADHFLVIEKKGTPEKCEGTVQWST